ncbi:MAG: hypothetical protein VR68_11670 [Peptococcaceae bacterium BRH_c4a]|nr:MAG: hypothetical protein VR68_11670 [Peptococcaceae bacterium BRH_c4a]
MLNNIEVTWFSGYTVKQLEVFRDGISAIIDRLKELDIWHCKNCGEKLICGEPEEVKGLCTGTCPRCRAKYIVPKPE